MLKFLLEPFWNPTGTQLEPSQNAEDNDGENDDGGDGGAGDEWY